MKKNILLGLIATIGIAIIGIGEWLILFNPEGGYGFGNYDFLAGKSETQLNWGHSSACFLPPLISSVTTSFLKT